MNNSFKKMVRYALILAGYVAVVNLIKDEINDTIKEAKNKIYRDY